MLERMSDCPCRAGITRAAAAALFAVLGGCTGALGPAGKIPPGGAAGGPGTSSPGGGASGTTTGGSTGATLDCTAPHAAVVASQQLSSTQYTNTVQDLFR